MKSIFSVLLMTLFTLPGALAPAQSTGRDTKKVLTVCDVIAAPEKYVGKRIRFVGVYQSAFSMPDLLIHPACDGASIIVNFDTDSPEWKSLHQSISEKRCEDGTGVLGKGEFIFTGVLMKSGERLPIENLLQEYMMTIKSADPR